MCGSASHEMYVTSKKLFSSLSLKEKEAVDTKLFHAVQQGLIILGLGEALAFRSIRKCPSTYILETLPLAGRSGDEGSG